MGPRHRRRGSPCKKAARVVALRDRVRRLLSRRDDATDGQRRNPPQARGTDSRTESGGPAAQQQVAASDRAARSQQASRVAKPTPKREVEREPAATPPKERKPVAKARSESTKSTSTSEADRKTASRTAKKPTPPATAAAPKPVAVARHGWADRSEQQCAPREPKDQPATDARPAVLAVLLAAPVAALDPHSDNRNRNHEDSSAHLPQRSAEQR